VSPTYFEPEPDADWRIGSPLYDRDDQPLHRFDRFCAVEGRAEDLREVGYALQVEWEWQR
jgi:hypothetical protein